MNFRALPKNASSNKGQSLVELAISVMVLLILVAGLVDLSHAIFSYLSMRDAAQEAMVYGSIYPQFCDQMVDMVRSNVGDNSIEVDVLFDAQPGIDGYPCRGASLAHKCAGKQIEVVVTQPHFPITMPLIGGFLGTQELRLEARIKGTVLSPVCP